MKKAIKFILAMSFIAAVAYVIYTQFFKQNKTIPEINHPHGKRVDRGWKNRSYQGQQRKYNRRGLNRNR